MINKQKTAHVAIDSSWPTGPLGRIDNVLDGVTGSVELWDFSLANSSYEARVHFVTKVASVCYQSPKSLGSVNLFNRLEAESAGLPSSSYEFVPVLLDKQILYCDGKPVMEHCIKYGEQVGSYWLCNLRALIEDVGSEESLNYLNTSEEEQQIIRDNFKVFLYNVDVPTRTQMIRHRVSWQELSRRYVSGKKSPFDFYVSKKMVDAKTFVSDEETDSTLTCIDTLTYIELGIELYNYAISSGVKPEEARRILPQAMMTTIWGAWQPKQLDSFFKLRLHKTAQREIQQTAQAMYDLIHAQSE